MRSLSWPLLTIPITDTECTKIMESSLISVLDKLEIISTIKRNVLYSFVHLQGMGFKNLYILPGATQCSIMIQLYNTDTDLGILLKTSLECMTMESGLKTCTLHYDYKKSSPSTTQSWMKHLWQYCYIRDVTLYMYDHIP